MYTQNPDHTSEDQRELLGSLFNVTRLELIEFKTEVMLSEKPDKFPTFRCKHWTLIVPCFIDENELNDKLKTLGSFLQNAPCLEKLTLECCMVLTLCLLCLVSCHVSYNLLRYLTRILY